MRRLFKLLVYIVVLGGVGLVGYAYIGPFLGVDFSPPQEEIRQRIILDAQ